MYCIVKLIRRVSLLYAVVGCVAQWQKAGLWPANLPSPALGPQPTGDRYVGKPSAIGQPTRPTQPFIPPRYINE